MRWAVAGLLLLLLLASAKGTPHPRAGSHSRQAKAAGDLHVVTVCTKEQVRLQSR